MSNKKNLKQDLCSYLLENGKVKENDVINHSYSNNRLNDEKRLVESHNEMPCLTTRPDSLSDLRIRKLTPIETGRLMGFEDKDTKAMYESGMSDSSLYHCHGDSIVVTVQMAIFSNLFCDNDTHQKPIQDYVDSLARKEKR